MNLLVAALDTIPVGIIICDNNEKFVVFNDKAKDIVSEEAEWSYESKTVNPFEIALEGKSLDIPNLVIKQNCGKTFCLSAIFRPVYKDENVIGAIGLFLHKILDTEHTRILMKRIIDNFSAIEMSCN